MAKRKMVENTNSEAVANPDSTPEQAQSKIELPSVESPSISPAKFDIAAEPIVAETSVESTASAARESDPSVASASADETAPAAAPDIVAVLASRPRFILRPRHKRYALLAATVAIAAALGAVFGAASSGGFSRLAAVNIPADENKATQQSVARLTKEIDSLKASLEATNKSAHSQIAKISERLNHESVDVTGSIAPPQTVPPAPQTAAPLPTPRPAPAAAEMPPRMSIVADWSIRETRDGYVYVQGHGDVYQVVPGAPLPGLGPVEQIKRQDGRWLVVTPKGIIVSLRDRRYFEQF